MTDISFGSCAADDELGRSIARYGEVPDRRPDRYVGIFYFLWLGQHGTGGPHDITQILAEDPEVVHRPEDPLWGDWRDFHFWGEPLYGYYLADDPWVLRRHVQLLTNAAIDFLVFDTTNAVTYKPVYDALFSVLEEIRGQGWDVPRFVFYTNTETGETIEELYQDIYRPGRYPELWFQWEGKPLIIGDPEACSPEVRQFFTFRRNQWPNEEQKPGGFPWIEFQRPQRVYPNNRGEPEVLSVSVAQHPGGVMSDTPFYGYGPNWGRSFHDGANDEAEDAFRWGYNIDEQWEFALKQDPEIVHITGWNEWIAMKLQGPPERPVRFVDQATLNFSRDIEPMRGGYNDCYYLQMIDHIRRFRGLGPQEDPGPKVSLDVRAEFSQWEGVGPEYRDYTGDTQPRQHGGYGGVTYRDSSGRNDLAVMKVARDDENLYFYARTDGELSPCTDPHWMLLFLNTDGAAGTGWAGYNYILNRRVVSATETTMEQSRGGWNWDEVGRVEYRASGRELQLAVPRSLLGLDDRSAPLTLRFKWADNCPQHEGEVMDFYQYGDVAPDGRLDYVYTEDPALLG